MNKWINKMSQNVFAFSTYQESVLNPAETFSGYWDQGSGLAWCFLWELQHVSHAYIIGSLEVKETVQYRLPNATSIAIQPAVANVISSLMLSLLSRFQWLSQWRNSQKLSNFWPELKKCAKWKFQVIFKIFSRYLKDILSTD